MVKRSHETQTGDSLTAVPWYNLPSLSQIDDKLWISLDSGKSEHKTWRHIQKSSTTRRTKHTDILFLKFWKPVPSFSQLKWGDGSAESGGGLTWERKGRKNCPESKDKASKELSKLLRDQICHDHRHVISKWSLNVQSIKKYPSPWPLERA